MPDVQDTTNLTLFQFEGQRLRVFMDPQGMVWWVATDVCRILGLENTSDTMKRLKSQEKNTLSFREGIPGSEGMPGNHTVNLVNEPGLYRLIFRSNKPQAERFQDKVFYEILPSIRATGTYTDTDIMPTRAEVLRSNHLASQVYPIRERAHISTYLLAVWTTLRQAEDPLSNAEISAKTAMKVATVRKWTRYLLYLGVVDMYETCPEHLFEIPPQADKRHAGYFQRLERLAAMMEQRQRRLFT